MTKCPRCGAELESGDSESLCAPCLMAGAFETESIADLILNAPPSPADEPEDVALEGFGHYRIVRELGHGGMGTVYLADQMDPIRRQVAVKVVKLGMDSAQVLARFDNERRALGLMDHPNVARIYDAGATPNGRPYFVMEYIDGLPITRYCDTHRLTTTQRLHLFVRVCLAVKHAHQKGIIHRDIKPSNVLVTEQDGSPVPKVIDFGIARAIEQRSLEFSLFTQSGQMIGTPEYMSPEQADVISGDVDARSDVYSLGVLLYELLIGAVPFEAALLRKAGLAELLRIIREEAAPPLSAKLTSLGRTASDVAASRQTNPEGLRKQLTGDLNWIVMKVLEKNRDRRYSSVSDLAADVSRHLENRPVLAGPPDALYRVEKFVHRHKAGVGGGAVLIVLLVCAALSATLYRRAENRHWVREQAVPDAARLKNENRPLAALRLIRKAQGFLPGDPELSRITDELTHKVTVSSTPLGATVEIQDYLSPGEPWYPLGQTPLQNADVPSGYLRWRLSKRGTGEYVSAPVPNDIHGYIGHLDFDLAANAAAPKGMVAVPPGPAFSVVWSLGDVGPFELPAFYVDKFEVTNREYQEFVDRGGYQRHEYWQEKFFKDGRELTWEQAIALFRDGTGKTGPSTWRDGHFPAGQADYPTGGVSWYEAAAYAAYAGKSLPVLAQWYLVAPSPIAKYIMRASNFSGMVAPAGEYQGVGPWGTYDMAGNLAEWCQTASGNGRYQLGGAAVTATNEYFEPGIQPPFHRAASSGFRCVRNAAALPAAAMAPRTQTVRDFATVKPAGDDIFAIYKAMYSYDHTPLNARRETVPQNSPDWRTEKITFDAAYGQERVTTYLFVPAHTRPPYQSVVFYPSARALDTPSSQSLADMHFIDYVIRSGRVVVYPVYKGTYERTAPPPGNDSAAGRETLIQDAKDMRRSLDYLETRRDMDHGRIAFMGESMGAALGVNLAALEERLKAVIFLDGGFYSEKPLPGTDQADFAPRINAPVLLISGQFDWIFLGKEALMRLIGTPTGEKKAVLFDTAHDVSERPEALAREVIAWLDRYLGRVE